MKPPKFPTIDKYIRAEDKPITSGPKSHQGLIVPELVFEYSATGRPKLNRRIAMRLIGSFKESRKSAKSIIKNGKDGHKSISREQLKDFEYYLKSIGVDQIAYTKVSPDHVFKDRQVLYTNAIVMLMAMNREAIDQAPSIATHEEIFRTYYQLGVDVNKGADYLRKNGFNAEAGPALGGATNYVLLARAAGLGEIGKHGLLINEHFGPSLRIAVIYTEIENLPVALDNPYEWVNDFCLKCRSCVKHCPASAIYEQATIFEDATEQHIDYQKCAVPFANNHGCTLCIKNCVFYTSDYNKVKERWHATS